MSAPALANNAMEPTARAMAIWESRVSPWRRRIGAAAQGRRVLGPLARPITRLEPAPLRCAPGLRPARRGGVRLSRRPVRPSSSEKEVVPVPHPRYASEEIVQRGQALYDRQIRAEVEPGHKGEFLVVDIETGEYELDVSELAAVKRAKAKNPDAALYILRVGYPAAYRVGGHGLVVPA